MNRQLEREEAYLEKELSEGRMTLKEYNHEMLELHRDCQAAAEEAAREAYERELDRW